MNILLTGGSGFIGKNLLENLNKDYTIFSPSHSDLDLCNWQNLETYINLNKIDIVIHTAVGRGDTVLSDTLRMFFAILRNADKVKKIIHFGSGAEYAKTRDLIKVKEEYFGKNIPLDDYGFAKYICSQTARNYKNVITLRLFGIYGKYENYLMKFISNVVAKNLVGLPIRIKQDVVFDYLYIDDLIPTVKYVIEHNMKHHDYNVTPTESISLSQIAHVINEVSDKKSSVSIANKGLNFQYTGDNTKIRSEISNISFTSYKDGIALLHDYYKSIIHQLDIKELTKDQFFHAKSMRK